MVFGTPSELFVFFFFNDPATTEISTLPLHDALPISSPARSRRRKCERMACCRAARCQSYGALATGGPAADRKSTRLNSSHGYISYAVFCLKKKKKEYLAEPADLALHPQRVHRDTAAP